MRRRRLLLALCYSGAIGTMLSCARTAAPAAIPDTPAGRAFRAWLDAYNAADSARLEAYVRRYESDMSVYTQLVFRQQTGPWNVGSIERSDPRHLEVILRTGSDAVRRYSDAITMYGVIDLADTATSRARTAFTLVGTGDKPPVRRITGAQRTVAIDSVVAKVLRNYVFPDVATRVADSLRARRARGVYDDYGSEISFAHRLDGDLLELGRDKQLGVEYAWRVPMPMPVPAPPAMVQHCGFEPPSVLDDSVGYLKFYGFREPERDCGHEVSNAMNAVASTRALIIDLRENAGGSPSMMAYLASYLVAGCTHLGDVWNRRTSETEKRWTRDGLSGPAFGGTKPLYILTSVRTFSAAEELAYALRSLGRATIVGETTGGGAHVTALGQIGEHLLVRVPIARVVDPVTATNWQGVGVTPDVSVPASEALAAAQRLIREGHVARASVSTFSNRLRASQMADEGTVVSPHPLRGVRFAVDTIDTHGGWRGLLASVGGVVAFANGRGRFDVTAVRPGRTMSLNGVTIARPLAKPGDYYLFDNAGFILVRPASRTFSSFVFTRAEFNHTGALLPGAFMFKEVPVQSDTLLAGDVERLTQHAAVSLHWHMQPPNSGALYARGWLEVEDAPAVEAGVARWFEVAAAVATMQGGVSALASKGLEVTSIALLRRPAMQRYQLVFSEMLYPSGLTDTDVDPARLVLPSGYAETSWPGFERMSGVQTPMQTTGVRWQTLMDSSTQRRRAMCRVPWLPEARAAR